MGNKRDNHNHHQSTISSTTPVVMEEDRDDRFLLMETSSSSQSSLAQEAILDYDNDYDGQRFQSGNGNAHQLIVDDKQRKNSDDHVDNHHNLYQKNFGTISIKTITDIDAVVVSDNEINDNNKKICPTLLKNLCEKFMVIKKEDDRKLDENIKITTGIIPFDCFTLTSTSQEEIRSNDNEHLLLNNKQDDLLFMGWTNHQQYDHHIDEDRFHGPDRPSITLDDSDFFIVKKNGGGNVNVNQQHQYRYSNMIDNKNAIMSILSVPITNTNTIIINNNNNKPQLQKYCHQIESKQGFRLSNNISHEKLLTLSSIHNSFGVDSNNITNIIDGHNRNGIDCHQQQQTSNQLWHPSSSYYNSRPTLLSNIFHYHYPLLTIDNNSMLNQQQQQQSRAKSEKKSTIVDSVLQMDHPPINPIDFLERYRLRNSSQQMLVSPTGSEFNTTLAMFQNNMNTKVEKKACTQVESSESSTDIVNKSMERGQWSGKLDFVFSCISYAVGLGNVWRFPYLCYENGGGAFLLPYLICIFVIGVPLFLMEVSLGQYFHAGGVSIWNKIPIFKGVGLASMIMIGLCNTYYIIIIAWTLYYLFNSLHVKLPWMSCDNKWNTFECFIRSDDPSEKPNGSVSPAQEFWKRKVLDISNDMAEIGEIQWHLFVTLILAWILVYAVIYKGIHQSGKIIWFMAMFPYVILTVLFAYGISLPGALTGIKFYISPQWHMLTEAKIWVAAGTQLLFTYGIGIGTNIALGSYNPTNHNFYRDSFIACLLSSFTSLFSGFVIFSVLGHMAYTMNTSVREVARSGPGLAFIVYPEAVTRLPLPNLWAILFFVMLLVLGIDSQFCTVESFITGIVDEWPHLLRPHRKLFTLFVVVIHFILGISMITSGGMYIFQLMDNFSASGITLIVVVLFELIAFTWIYGGKRIYNNMVEMLDFNPPRILYYLWCYISPASLLGILIFSIVDYRAPEYAGRPFPWYGEIFGWCIASASIIFIPVYMFYYTLFKCDQNLSLKERLATGFRPSDDNEQSLRIKADIDNGEMVINTSKSSQNIPSYPEQIINTSITYQKNLDHNCNYYPNNA